MNLVSVLVAVGISAVIGLGAATQFKNSFSAQKNLELRGDAEAVRRLLMDSLDCDALVDRNGAAIDLDNPALCDSTSEDDGQTGPWIWLRRSTRDGSVSYLTPQPNPSGIAKLGNWSIRASCSKTEQSLVVRLARIDGDGNFMKDPLTGRVQDWNAPRSLLFGASTKGGVSFCFTDSGAKWLSPVAQSINTIYQAKSSGMVVASGWDYGKACALYGKTGATSPPLQNTALDSARQTNVSMNVSFPVVKNQYYQAWSNCSGSVMHFWPMR